MYFGIDFDTQETSAKIQIGDCILEDGKIYLSCKCLTEQELISKINELQNQLRDIKIAGIAAFRKYGNSQALPTKTKDRVVVRI